jgi:hypothetical protein
VSGGNSVAGAQWMNSIRKPEKLALQLQKHSSACGAVGKFRLYAASRRCCRKDLTLFGAVPRLDLVVREHTASRASERKEGVWSGCKIS